MITPAGISTRQSLKQSKQRFFTNATEQEITQSKCGVAPLLLLDQPRQEPHTRLTEHDATSNWNLWCRRTLALRHLNVQCLHVVFLLNRHSCRVALPCE